MSTTPESTKEEILRFIANRESDDRVDDVADLAIDLVISWGLETADAIYILTNGYQLAAAGPAPSAAAQNEAQLKALTAYQRAVDGMYDIVGFIEQAAKQAVDCGDDDED